MNRIMVRTGALLSVLALVLATAQTGGQEPPRAKGPGPEKAAARIDAAAVARLVRQLGSDDFQTREKASEQLAALDEVPDLLREAARNGDAEVARRAQSAIAAITGRIEEKAFQAMIRDLHKVELDRFVRRMVTDEKFAGEQQWKVIQTIARAVSKEADKLGERHFDVPDFATMPPRRLLYNRETKNPVSVNGLAILSAGPTPYITSVMNSLVIVDGDFGGATGINNSLLIVRGNVGRVTGVTKSIILATGNWEGATSCTDSFVQVNNQRIRFTSSRNSVLIKTAVRATLTTSRTLGVDRGPLQLLKFSPRKTDEQLAWGKEVNNLAIAITPAEQKDQFLIRWKNFGKDTLELAWIRLNSDVVYPNRDDLLDHVFLKGPNGKPVPARKYPGPRAGPPPGIDRTVVLCPGQSHEETIDLWTYLEKPATDGRYQLSIELDLPEGRQRWEPDAKPWSGKIQSNVLDVSLGK
jgi:hypothetical protein